MVAKHVNNAGKPRVLAINPLLHSLAALAATSSAVAFYLLPLITMQSHRQSEFDVWRIRPRKASYPTLKRLHGKILPRLRGLPGLPDQATRLGWSPHLSCKRDQIKIKDYLDGRVTPPKRVTSRTIPM